MTRVVRTDSEPRLEVGEGMCVLLGEECARQEEGFPCTQHTAEYSGWSQGGMESTGGEARQGQGRVQANIASFKSHCGTWALTLV